MEVSSQLSVGYQERAGERSWVSLAQENLVRFLLFPVLSQLTLFPGKRVANIGRALGMTVLLSDRKSALQPRHGRTSFAEVISRATVIMVTAVLTPSTLDLVSGPELSLMRPDAVIINIARGGIINEKALVQALREGKVKGAASDVFVEEPAGSESSPLLKAAREGDLEGRLVVTPHVAWYARSSLERMRNVTGTNIEAWFAGRKDQMCSVDIDRDSKVDEY